MITKYNVNDKVLTPLTPRPGMVKAISIAAEPNDRWTIVVKYLVELRIAEEKTERFFGIDAWFTEYQMALCESD